MLIQISTNIKLKPIKRMDKNRTMFEYIENNTLYKKGRKCILYECDIRQPNIFEID